MKKNDIYAMVTDKVIAALENGVAPWKQPWINIEAGNMVSFSTGKPYSCLNQLLMACQGAGPGEYLTFDQCKKAGGHVKKGAKSKMVTFWKQISVKDKKIDVETGEEFEQTSTIPVLKYYTVFSVDDCEGIEHKHWSPEGVLLPGENLERQQMAEDIIAKYVANSGVEFKSMESNKAFYSPSLDRVVVPLLSQYSIADEFYSTAFHELTHSTGIDSRCKRGLDGFHRFGSNVYSKEELVAEFGAAMLCGKCGLTSDTAFSNSVAYLQGWGKALKSDPKLFISAAAKAEKAVKFILGEK